MVTRAQWVRQLAEHPDRPQGRQHRQLDALIVLAGLLDAKTGQGDVPVLELAKATGVSERTARRALAWAVQAGVIQRSRRGRGAGTATATASAWQLAVPRTPRLAASPERLAANSRGLAANSTKVAKPGRRTKARGTGTPIPPPASEVLAHREHCRDCGFELDPVLVEAGMRVHPTCSDPLTRRMP
jgi:hypothetical protein